jgi:hypothetical protein
MPQIKKCYVIDCSSSGLTKKTSFHCFPANLELNLQWKEALINHAGSTISMIFFFSKTPISFCFSTDVECFTFHIQSIFNILLDIILPSCNNIFSTSIMKLMMFLTI